MEQPPRQSASPPTSPRGTLSSTHDVRQRRPCDRCHKIKEKCRWPTDDSEVCERCCRLKHNCQTLRPRGKAGRKARRASGDRMALRTSRSRGEPSVMDTDSTTGLSSSDLVRATTLHQNQLHPEVAQFPELNNVELYLLNTMLTKQIEVDKYLIGPSFREQHQQAFADYLRTGMSLLKDAFIACAVDLVGDENIRQVAINQHVGHKRAAAALASLRSLDIHDIHDVSMIVALGAALITFASHHSGDELLLCRCVLGLVKSLYKGDRSLIRNMSADGMCFLICLLGTEINACLFQGQIPTMRVAPEEFGECVDRFIGVSAQLLAHFSDICKVSHAIHHSGCRQKNNPISTTLSNSLDQIEKSIVDFQPAVPDDVINTRFTPIDVKLMLSQGKILRLTALLVIHRLCHAFGSSDGKAHTMSQSILHELNLVTNTTGQSMPFAELAFMVACMEIINPTERLTVLAQSHAIIGFGSRLRSEVEQWLFCWWTLRDDGTNHSIYWDDVGSLMMDVQHRYLPLNLQPRPMWDPHRAPVHA